MGGIKLGKVLGFEISVDWSWLLIFFLVAYTLAIGWFPMRYNFSSSTNWLLGFTAAVLLFTSVLVHELTHSVLSRRYGNEVKGIVLFLFGGVSQTKEEPRRPTEEFWMALAGPISSLVLAGMFFALRHTALQVGWPLPWVAILDYMWFINLLLGLFNLIPGFPLDGGRVLRSVIWAASNDLDRATRYASGVGQAFGYLLMAFGLFNALGGGWVGGLWFMFIGWFLAGSARQSYEQMKMRQALTGIPVEQVMTTEVPAIPAATSVRQFVDEELLRNDYSCYPVVSDGAVIGVIGAEEVRSVPSVEWTTTSVGDIALRVNGNYSIDKTDDAWEALARLSTENVCRLMVFEDGLLQGTVGRDSLQRLVQKKMQLGELS